MKQGGLLAVCLFLLMLAASGVSVYADDKTVNLESVIVQTFDDPQAQPWFVVGSRFHTDGYPKYTYYKAIPNALKSQVKADSDYKALGIAMMFDRKEYNYIDVIPGTMKFTNDNKPDPDIKEIPLPGRVKYLDVWVWGSGFSYNMEAYVRDYKGVVHILPMGSLNFEGWKNLRVEVPATIPQSKHYIPRLEVLKLLKFRIWTNPSEVVAVSPDPNQSETAQPIYVYIDQLKVLTDTFESLIDGNELQSPDVVKEAWSSASDKPSGK
jgi:hypothetical protein